MECQGHYHRDSLWKNIPLSSLAAYPLRSYILSNNPGLPPPPSGWPRIVGVNPKWTEEIKPVIQHCLTDMSLSLSNPRVDRRRSKKFQVTSVLPPSSSAPSTDDSLSDVHRTPTRPDDTPVVAPVHTDGPVYSSSPSSRGHERDGLNSSGYDQWDRIRVQHVVPPVLPGHHHVHSNDAILNSFFSD